MKIQSIKTERDHEEALKRLRVIFHAEKDSPEGDELNILLLLIDQYEAIHYPIGMPDPIDAIIITMEDRGYKQTDLAQVLGLKSRASEILNRKRKLTLEMIRRLNAAWNIPIESLVAAY